MRDWLISLIAALIFAATLWLVGAPVWAILGLAYLAFVGWRINDERGKS